MNAAVYKALMRLYDDDDDDDDDDDGATGALHSFFNSHTVSNGTFAAGLCIHILRSARPTLDSFCFLSSSFIITFSNTTSFYNFCFFNFLSIISLQHS